MTKLFPSLLPRSLFLKFILTHSLLFVTHASLAFSHSVCVCVCVETHTHTMYTVVDVHTHSVSLPLTFSPGPMQSLLLLSSTFEVSYSLWLMIQCLYSHLWLQGFISVLELEESEYQFEDLVSDWLSLLKLRVQTHTLRLTSEVVDYRWSLIAQVKLITSTSGQPWLTLFSIPVRFPQCLVKTSALQKA